MTLFKNKYRIESARLKAWDYSSTGWYFVTICTRGKECFFGDVLHGEMQLSPIGDIVAEEWQKAATIRPNVALDEWIVMPNHIHGIIVINNDPVETSRRGVSPIPQQDHSDIVETPRRGVSTIPQQDHSDIVETPRRGVSTDARSRLKPGSLGAIVGQYKTVCTKRIWARRYSDFGWQERFFDHIIRNEKSLNKIREYIINNPANWHADQNNPANLWM